MCCVAIVELAPAGHIPRTYTVFGVIIGMCMWTSSWSNMLRPLLLMPIGVCGMSVHIHFVGFLHGIAYSMCGTPHMSSLKTAISIYLRQSAKRFASHEKVPLKHLH
jgi:hypothetical protein